VTGKRPEEAEALLAFVDRMHEAGVIQHDLHGANLLWNPDRAEMRLVDLYGCQIQDRVSPGERLRNLAFLRMTLPIPVSPEVADLSLRMRKEAGVYRSKRAWKHNREFAPKQLGGMRWQVRIPLIDARASRILADPDGFLDREARPLKRGRSATVGAADGLVLKRYNFKKPLNLVKDLFRPSRAYRAFRQAYHLELVGIPTACPVAAATRRRFGLAVGSYFLMQEIPGAISLQDHALDPAVVVSQAAELLARLHSEGFYHRDLKATNLVYDQEGRLYLIDLEGLFFAGDVPHQRALEDMTRLWRSVESDGTWATHHVRAFLKRYCRHRSIRLRTLLLRTR
jgi:tRNA A-37 threonylcarbamoyl transferase component Bud32